MLLLKEFDLGPHCLQRLSADYTGIPSVNQKTPFILSHEVSSGSDNVTACNIIDKPEVVYIFSNII